MRKQYILFFLYIQKQYILIRKHSIPFSWFPYVAETDPSVQQYTESKLSSKVDQSTYGVTTKHVGL